MRSIGLALSAAGFLFLSGCGCLDPLVVVHPLGSQPDPDQPAWNRFLCGTRYVPAGPRPSVPDEGQPPFKAPVLPEKTP